MKVLIAGRLQEDTYRHKGMRKKLCDEIKQKGISDPRILEAINKIPRHFFLDSSFVEFAYQDKPFPIGEGQTISQPYTVAFQSQLLQVTKGMKVLEIGTGSGYQACVLAELGAKVFSVERVKALYDKTKITLPAMGYNPKLYFGDGYKGLPIWAPFQRILVTAAAPIVPQALIDQLAVGGILVIPVGDHNGIQIMRTYLKNEDGSLTMNEHGTFRFVPMMEDKKSL